MKKIFTILALSLGVMSVSAEDIKGNSYFIGGNVGVTNSKVNLQNDKLKDLSLRLGIDVGYIINDEWRTYIGYKFTTKAKDALRNNVDAKISDQHQVHFGVDYTPRFIGNTKLVAGVYTGVKFAKVSEGAFSVKTNGYVLGARTGILAEVTDNVEAGILVNVDKTWNKKGDFKAQEVDYGTAVVLNYKF